MSQTWMTGFSDDDFRSLRRAERVRAESAVSEKAMEHVILKARKVSWLPV